MGIIRKGANGGFSGKAGSVIGSNWKDISYIKGLPKISNKAKTIKQLEQQAKFTTAIKFLQPVKDLLNVGFGKQNQGRASGYNMAVKHVLDNAITGIYPDYTIDYSKAIFAKGGVADPVGATVFADQGNLILSWSPDINPFNGFPEDEVTMLVFDPLSNIYLSGPLGVVRTAGEITFPIPPAYFGNTVHVYLFYISRLGKLSNSVYAGEAVIE